MNEPAEHEAAYNTDQPQGEQNNKQRPQHHLTLGLFLDIARNMVPPEENRL